MDIEEIKKIKKDDIVYAFNVEFYFDCLSRDCIFLLNPRLDFDSYIILLEKYYKFFSTVKDHYDVLYFMDCIEDKTDEFYTRKTFLDTQKTIL